MTPSIVAVTNAPAPGGGTTIGGIPLEYATTYDDKHHERKMLKEKLAAGFRIFAKYGFDEGVAGHLSLRDPIDPTSFWVNPFGKHFALIKASDLILVNHKGDVIDGGPNRLLNKAAFMIHSAVHEARPEVACAAHAHSIYGRTFASLGRELEMITQDSCAFYKDHALYNQFNGVVHAQQEGMNVAAALGNNKVALLQNHGILSTGKTIEAAVFWFLSMEKCCQSQLLADAACGGRGGKPIVIDDVDAASTYMNVGTDLAGWFSGVPLFDLIEKETGGDYKD